MIGALKKAVDEHEASASNYAYLFDRVEVLEGKPQHWGTQSRCQNNRAVLYPGDATTSIVEERRYEIGLESLAESLRRSDAICVKLGSP
jgi:hypothetical protein